MCRLFGMHAGNDRARATFWLLHAANSLAIQSHYEPDGTGVGTFDASGHAIVNKQPLTAWKDREFAQEAKNLKSETFLAHVRYASTGAHTQINTHPFEEDNRLFAHNGIVEGLQALDERLGELGTEPLVRGQTDSERVFALITAEIRRANGDIRAGIKAALGWIAENLPVYSLNMILTTSDELWAVRYPETHELYVLDRTSQSSGEDHALVADSRRIRTHSPELADRHVVIVATEKMTDHDDWRLLESGELIQVGEDLRVSSEIIFDEPPRHLLKLEHLDQKAAASQHPPKTA